MFICKEQVIFKQLCNLFLIKLLFKIMRAIKRLDTYICAHTTLVRSRTYDLNFVDSLGTHHICAANYQGYRLRWLRQYQPTLLAMEINIPDVIGRNTICLPSPDL